MRWSRVAVGTVLTLGVFAPAGQAFAHAGLEASVPSANAVLESGPPNIELDFNEAVDAERSNIQLYDQAGKLIPTGATQSVTDDTGVQASVPSIDDGVYVVVGACSPPMATSSMGRSAFKSVRSRPESMSVR